MFFMVCKTKICQQKHFFTIGDIFFNLGAKNYFGIKKISYFGNYIDPCLFLVKLETNTSCKPEYNYNKVNSLH